MSSGVLDFNWTSYQSTLRVVAESLTQGQLAELQVRVERSTPLCPELPRIFQALLLSRNFLDALKRERSPFDFGGDGSAELREWTLRYFQAIGAVSSLEGLLAGVLVFTETSHSQGSFFQFGAGFPGVSATLEKGENSTASSGDLEDAHEGSV